MKLTSSLSIHILSSVCLFCIFIGLNACSSWLPEAYTVSPQQGNTVTASQLKQVKLGLTKTQVNEVLGAPIIADPFHAQRWDYIYRHLPKSGFARKSHLILYFSKNKLHKIDQEEYIAP